MPLAIRAIWRADHSKNPISSSMSEIKITATKASVAFQTIPVTVATSLRLTTPNIKARIAPALADQPIFRPLGCHITKVKVSIKIITANIVILPPSITTVWI
ncbi:hypothetical protein D3C77_675560 [compost metagenome]